jgi:quinoprotein glucose dehydrogenase
VDQLEVAWTFRIGAPPLGVDSKLEATPLKIGETLYLCTAVNDIIALDAATGQQKWRFNSGASHKDAPYGVCRGVAHFQIPGATGVCAGRIITNTIDARLIAVDARDGQPCPGFGTGGQTSLMTGMGNADPGYYYTSSAPTIVHGKIILGGWVSDGQFWGEPPGVIRAYDAVTGRFAWAFDPGQPNRHDEPAAADTYTLATPNGWGPMSADETLGLVYVPTGNSTPDFYGAQRRPFDDQYSSSVIALDADTGVVRWSFQTTHHDLWDYDVASQPTLVDLPMPDGSVQRALIQPTKRGEVFMLDRATGRPLATVEERAVPQRGRAPGEHLSPTQPFSVGLPSLAGPQLTERDMWGITPLDQLWCRILFRKAQYDGTMTPPGPVQTIISPGSGGGSNWVALRWTSIATCSLPTLAVSRWS